LFVIHPDPAQIGARALEAFVARLNARMAAETLTSDLQAFEAHPDSEFCIGGMDTRRSPYPSFQVLSRARLKRASDSLCSGPATTITPRRPCFARSACLAKNGRSHGLEAGDTRGGNCRRGRGWDAGQRVRQRAACRGHRQHQPRQAIEHHASRRPHHPPSLLSSPGRSSRPRMPRW
jgi:hypothetical protein